MNIILIVRARTELNILYVSIYVKFKTKHCGEACQDISKLCKGSDEEQHNWDF